MGGAATRRPEFCYFVIHVVTRTFADTNNSDLAGGRSGVWCALLLVLPHRHWASVADSAVRPGLRRVNRCAAMASPRHMSTVAGTPHGTNGPAAVTVGVTVRAACR